MSKKVLTIRLDGCKIDCIQTADKRNPYHVYKITNEHRFQIDKCGDFIDVLAFLKDLFDEGMERATVPEIIEWEVERRDILSIFQYARGV